MSRADKIKKLANAIREYRGLREPGTGRWINSPRPAAGERVVKWLGELGRNVAADFLEINSFTKVSEFNAWLKKLEQPVNPCVENKKATA